MTVLPGEVWECAAHRGAVYLVLGEEPDLRYGKWKSMLILCSEEPSEVGLTTICSAAWFVRRDTRRIA